MSDPTAAQTLDLALEAHRAGDLGKAEGFYRQILSQQPDAPDALHLLGVLMNQRGAAKEGLALIHRAISIKPDDPMYYTSLGTLLVGSDLDGAIAAFEKAVALKPGFAEGYNNLGNALRAKGRSADAIASYRRAIILRPDYGVAHYSLANALQENGQIDQAIASYQQAITLLPNYPEFHNDLGGALRAKGENQEAIASYQKAIALRLAYPQAHNNLGNMWMGAGELDNAIIEFQTALSLRPDYFEAAKNLGEVLMLADQPAKAADAYRKAMQLQPQNPNLRWLVGRALLLTGDFLGGWAEYESRWEADAFADCRRNFSAPQWRGESLGDKRLLLHAEQGFGDAIQFVRYVPIIAERGDQILLECQPELIRLFQQVPGVKQLIARGEALPQFDVQSSLFSLPWVMKTTLDSIHADIPYLTADPDLAEQWKTRLSATGNKTRRLKVGLAWAGSTLHKSDKERSIALNDLAPLGDVPDITFYSLQKGAAAAQVGTWSGKSELIDWTNDLHDFADTAALLENLDLVIAVDTAVVHLAGAMGKPVWVLQRFDRDFRWMMERKDSPWYPSMRLYRQAKPGDWGEPLGNLLRDLRAFGK